MNFQQQLDAAIENNNSLLCVGLDPVLGKLPQHLQKTEFPFFTFNKALIDATHDLVCAYKPNSAFYEALGEKGIGELKKTCDYIKTQYPEIPIILDAKRGDIGSTNAGYVSYCFDYLHVDAVTLQPYLGREALNPFLQHKEKGLIILCKTSNPGSGEFQSLPVILNASEESYSTERDPSTSLRFPDPGLPSPKGRAQDDRLYKIIAKNVAKHWNTNQNCFLVVGATYPEELAEVRKIVGDMTLLVPGLGSQGGEVGPMMEAGLNSKKKGMIINSSREVIYAGDGEDFAEKLRDKSQQLRDTINRYR
jgi:orotidine-5'-phosphate decarboxylase